MIDTNGLEIVTGPFSRHWYASNSTLVHVLHVKLEADSHVGLVCMCLLRYGVHFQSVRQELMQLETQNGLGKHLLAAKPGYIRNLLKVNSAPLPCGLD